MFKPVFPYKGNQLILTSDRVTLHSKSDAIFLFGKQAVSLSSTKTINLDANEGIKLYTPIIELGYNARAQGQPVVLGRNLNQQLINLLSSIAAAGTMLRQASSENLGATMQNISSAGITLNKAASDLANLLSQDFILSKNTFTR
jgi:hypothetical protein